MNSEQENPTYFFGQRPLDEIWAGNSSQPLIKPTSNVDKSFQKLQEDEE